MLLKDITDLIESIAPLSYQESYDNSGLIIGNKNAAVEKALICLDITEEVLEEAIEKNCKLVISHHPLIFKGIKKLNDKNEVERIIVKAIQHNIAIYAAHTNLDNAEAGVNKIFAEKLNLKNVRKLQPKTNLLRKLVCFCPPSHAETVKIALFEAGAGHIGNYDSCSFNIAGEGSFRALDNASPFVGNINELHTENEIRIETVYPAWLESKILKALFNKHPYEEVAYDIYNLENQLNTVGSGVIGEVEETDELSFLQKLKTITNTKCIRHTALLGNAVKKVALCGGAGSFLIHDAIAMGADVFVTGDVKYHDFFEAEKHLIIADIGHYESEQFTKELLYSIISKKFPNFAVLISEKNTNPIHYL
ncbi:MAG: Nif3-like dinuclear metal center hexameric protein [Bacteroidetes bacterium]|nr:Nif3-like dinuclear metal center hexameric protein [Bacteroidota bacterium]